MASYIAVRPAFLVDAKLKPVLNPAGKDRRRRRTGRGVRSARVVVPRIAELGLDRPNVAAEQVVREIGVDQFDAKIAVGIGIRVVPTPGAHVQEPLIAGLELPSCSLETEAGIEIIPLRVERTRRPGGRRAQQAIQAGLIVRADDFPVPTVVPASRYRARLMSPTVATKQPAAHRCRSGRHRRPSRHPWIDPAVLVITLMTQRSRRRRRAPNQDPRMISIRAISWTGMDHACGRPP